MDLKKAKELYGSDPEQEVDFEGKKMKAKDLFILLEERESAETIDINGIKIPVTSDKAVMQKRIDEATEESFKSSLDTFNKNIAKVSGMKLDNQKEAPVDKKKFKSYIAAIFNKRYDMIPKEFLHKDAPVYGNEGDNATGGYLVFDRFYNQILTFLAEYGNVIPDLTKGNMASKSLKFPKTNGIIEADFVDEGAEIGTGQVALAQGEFKRHDCGIIVPFTNDLLEDADFDLLAYISMIAGYGFAKKMETTVFNGNTGQTLIKGLYNESGVGSYNLTSVDLTGFSLDDIIDVVASLPANWRQKAKWYMHRTAWATIKKFKDKQNRYILDAQERLNKMLEGYPVIESEACNTVTDIAAATPFITFGDMSNNWLMQRVGMEIMSSTDATIKIGGTSYNLFQRRMQAVRLFTSFDIQPVNPSAFVNVKTKAAE